MGFRNFAPFHNLILLLRRLCPFNQGFGGFHPLHGIGIDRLYHSLIYLGILRRHVYLSFRLHFIGNIYFFILDGVPHRDCHGFPGKHIFPGYRSHYLYLVASGLHILLVNNAVHIFIFLGVYRARGLFYFHLKGDAGD